MPGQCLLCLRFVRSASPISLLEFPSMRNLVSFSGRIKGGSPVFQVPLSRVYFTYPRSRNGINARPQGNLIKKNNASLLNLINYPLGSFFGIQSNGAKFLFFFHVAQLIIFRTYSSVYTQWGYNKFLL